MKNAKRKPQINIEMKPEFIQELKEVSAVIEIPAAQIARDAIREKIAKLKRNDPRFKNESAQVSTNA